MPPPKGTSSARQRRSGNRSKQRLGVCASWGQPQTGTPVASKRGGQPIVVHARGSQRTRISGTSSVQFRFGSEILHPERGVLHHPSLPMDGTQRGCSRLPMKGTAFASLLWSVILWGGRECLNAQKKPVAFFSLFLLLGRHKEVRKVSWGRAGRGGVGRGRAGRGRG